MKILLVGDVHGEFQKFYWFINKVKKEYSYDMVIQVGDFGIMSSRDFEYLTKCAKSFTGFKKPIHFIDGNHESHQYILDTHTYLQKYGIYYQSRGSVMNIDNKNICFFGGALNVDRPQEYDDDISNVPSKNEIDAGINIFNTLSHIDLFVTHTCPASVGIGVPGHPMFLDGIEKYVKGFGYKPSPLNDSGDMWLTDLWNGMTVKPLNHVFGHYHMDRYKMVGDTHHYCIDMLSCRMYPKVFIYDTDKNEIVYMGQVAY